MGRWALSETFKGKVLEAALLADVLRRAATAEIAVYALVVDAKDVSVAGFYAHHGFIALSEQPLFLFLPLAIVKSLLDCCLYAPPSQRCALPRARERGASDRVNALDKVYFGIFHQGR